MIKGGIDVKGDKGMKAIWRYPLEIIHNKIEMPIGAKALSVITRNNTPMLYMLIDIDAPKTERNVYVYCTGCLGTGEFGHDNHIADMQFVGTVVTHDARYEWHIFIEPEVD